ncbi:MAG: hypothetical protein IPF54_22590 [Draconibacterium sp.]|nr:hypothetical protein [Draconibacterium sp.]
MKKNLTYLIAIAAIILLSFGAKAQGGLTPLVGSTHVYTVTPGSGSNDLKWTVSPATGFSITGDNTDEATITWTTAGIYTLTFTETNNATNCATVKTTTVNVAANSFDVSTSSPADFCNSADGQVNFVGSTATTGIIIPVSMITGISTFNPNWEITFTLTPNSGTTITAVAASSGTLSGTGPYTVTGLASASGEGTFDITMNVAGDIYSSRDVVLTITSAKELTYNTPDVDSDDWTATQTINSIPNTSTITTD